MLYSSVITKAVKSENASRATLGSGSKADNFTKYRIL